MKYWVLQSLRGLAVWLCVAPCLTALAAESATAFQYEVALEAPLAQRPLLQDNLDLYRWRGSERMSEAQLQRLLQLAPQQIRELLSTEGYYSPNISTELQPQGAGWLVQLKVDPGAPVRVAEIDLIVQGAFDDGSSENQTRLNQMRAGWSLAPQAVFRHAEWEAAKRDALKNLLLTRYPTATIASSSATVNPETQSVVLQVVFNSGPAFSFGALEIQGLRRYPASLIERLNPIVPGETYAQSKLLDLQSRLQDSPYFSAATVQAEPDALSTAAVPVRVEVVENQSRKLGFGIGASTDTGARGQVDYRDLNLFGRAWRFGTALKLEQKRQTLSADIQLPPTEKGVRDSFNSLIERTDIEGEITQKLGLGVKRSFVRGSTESTYGLRYLVETRDVEGATRSRSTTLSPSFAWTIRKVDNLLYPSRGFLLSLQTDVAARALLSDQDFVRGYARGVYFLPLGAHNQLILRSELGAVAAKSRRGIPSDYLFRTGGDQTVRGYDYQSLGVREGSATVGGRYLGLASVEVVHWLTPSWGAAAFVDGGNAADHLADLKPVLGYGLGARWKSPVGPLNLDVAYGQETRQLRLHFSVGFNF